MTFLRAYQADNPNTPLVIYGYSLGGTMALGAYFKMVADASFDVKAVLLVCP